MSALSDVILGFIGDLRVGGIRISTAESLDAMRAVAAAGLARSRMREALAASLIKDEADRAIFDEIFARRFAGRSPATTDRPRSKGARAGLHGSSGGPSAASATLAARRDRPDKDQAPTSAPAPKQSSERDLHQRPTSQTLDAKRHEGERAKGAIEAESGPHGADASVERVNDHGDAAHGEPESPGIAARHAAALRSIERLPFAHYSELDFESAREALGALKRRFRIRVSRRLRIAATGRIDLRRTIRASLQQGGALGDLRFRTRRPRHIDLLILADISGSVKYASTLMLELAAGARTCFRRVRSFVYIDRLAEAVFEHDHLVMTPALDLYARSDFGRVLAEVWERRASLITRATVIVIMGDGRNNRRPARADLLRDLTRLSRAALWLIPEPQTRWNTGDSAIGQYARAVTALIRCENLGELEHGIAKVR